MARRRSWRRAHLLDAVSVLLAVAVGSGSEPFGVGEVRAQKHVVLELSEGRVSRDEVCNEPADGQASGLLSDVGARRVGSRQADLGQLLAPRAGAMSGRRNHGSTRRHDAVLRHADRAASARGLVASFLPTGPAAKGFTLWGA
jgi:hypothetical protein